jgi:sugar (pentulose or hexulose) kinase
MGGTFFVGLDVGTQTSKAVVFTEAGDAVASGRAATPWIVSATGAEMDATALLHAAKSALGQALANCPPGRVAGLGVAEPADYHAGVS